MSRRSYTAAATLAALMLSHGLAFSQTAPQATQPQPAAQDQQPEGQAAQPAPAGNAAADQPEPTGREAPQSSVAENGRAECAWSGKRVVTLLWRDDINGAREQMRFYDRFLCPDAKLRDAFRCVITSGEFDPEKPESVASKVGQCWANPERQPQEPSAPAKPAAQ